MVSNTIENVPSFELNLFKSLVNENKDGNIVFSPLSIYIALSLTANGAVGTTQREMLDLLQASGIEQLNQKNMTIMKNESFSDSGKNILNLANAIFTRVKPTDEFQGVSQNVFNSTSDALQSVEQINKWCSDKTNGRIDKILENLSQNVQMILLNAVYFKGNWLKQFPKAQTSKRTFYDKSRNKTEVNMMYQKIKTKYFQDSTVQMIELPYNENNFSAYVILPDETVSIDDFILNLNSSDFYSNFTKMKNNVEVELSLPRFTLEAGSELKSHLISLGMKIAFTGGADFSNMTKETPLLVESVVHKAFIKIDEEGTEAAAVTKVTMSRCFVMVEKIEMIVDRPFLFVLKEKNIDLSLFISKVEAITN
jgi:serpin B